MDSRSVQKSGNMLYFYLPTFWCKKHKISSDSRIGILETPEGDLVISTNLGKKPFRELVINLDSCSENALQKLIMACYINPNKAFKIKIKNPPKLENLLSQKNLFGIELIEIENNAVSCESTISIDDPITTLKTMIRRLKTLIYIMATDFNPTIVAKYEDEIDREKTLIEKAVISSLAIHSLQKTKPIDMHYISKMSQNLESATDCLIELGKSEKAFFNEILPVIDKLKSIMEPINSINDSESILQQSIEFIDAVESLKDLPVKDMKTYYKRRFKKSIVNISEDIIDWAVTKKIEQSKN